MALPNIFHGHTMTPPGQGSNKNATWLCDGRTAFHWLRYAHSLHVDGSGRAQHALAIATALSDLDTSPPGSIHGGDEEDTERWMDAVETLDQMTQGVSSWDANFLASILENPPRVFSEPRKAQIRRMMEQYRGETL